MIIDATLKEWYPKVLEMSDDISTKVNENWKNY